MKYILYGLLLLVLILLGFYIKTILGFKKFLQYEQDMLHDPTDQKVLQYMDFYKKTYIPKQDHILDSRLTIYRKIKESPHVSYETKKALRTFFEAQGISTLTKTNQKNDDE